MAGRKPLSMTEKTETTSCTLLVSQIKAIKEIGGGVFSLGVRVMLESYKEDSHDGHAD